MGEPIPADVRQFIADHVESVGVLELLLLLAATPDKTWTTAELGRALVTGEDIARDQLARLAKDGLVSVQDGLYRYTPGPTGEVVDELADCYARRRHTVIGVIYGSDTRDASTIADAFRMRRKKR